MNGSAGYLDRSSGEMDSGPNESGSGLVGNSSCRYDIYVISMVILPCKIRMLMFLISLHCSGRIMTKVLIFPTILRTILYALFLSIMT